MLKERQISLASIYAAIGAFLWSVSVQLFQVDRLLAGLSREAYLGFMFLIIAGALVFAGLAAVAFRKAMHVEPNPDMSARDAIELCNEYYAQVLWDQVGIADLERKLLQLACDGEIRFWGVEARNWNLKELLHGRSGPRRPIAAEFWWHAEIDWLENKAERVDQLSTNGNPTFVELAVSRAALQKALWESGSSLLPLE